MTRPRIYSLIGLLILIVVIHDLILIPIIFGNTTVVMTKRVAVATLFSFPDLEPLTK